MGVEKLNFNHNYVTTFEIHQRLSSGGYRSWWLGEASPGLRECRGRPPLGDLGAKPPKLKT